MQVAGVFQMALFCLAQVLFGVENLVVVALAEFHLLEFLLQFGFVVFDRDLAELPLFANLYCPLLQKSDFFGQAVLYEREPCAGGPHVRFLGGNLVAFVDVCEQGNVYLYAARKHRLAVFGALEVAYRLAGVAVAAAYAVAPDKVERGQSACAVLLEFLFAQVEFRLLLQVGGVHVAGGIQLLQGVDGRGRVYAFGGPDGQGALVLYVLARGEREQQVQPCVSKLVECREPCAFAVGIFGDGLLQVEHREYAELLPFARVVCNLLCDLCRLGGEL